MLKRVAEPHKILIVEKSLVSLLDLNFKFSELEKAGVVRVLAWDPNEGSPEEERVPPDTALLYLQHSLSENTLPLLTQLAESIRARRAVRFLVFAPFVTELGMGRLRALGVDMDLAGVWALPELQSAILEEDTISLQISDFANFHSRDDPSLLTHMAVFLKDLETCFGIGLGHEEVGSKKKFRKINAIGTASKYVVDLFLQMGRGERQGEEGEDDYSVKEGEFGMTKGIGRIGGIRSVGGLLLQQRVEGAGGGLNLPQLLPSEAIDSVVLIDRRSDLFSLLCSQFTYEALVDEIFGIVNTKVKFSHEGEGVNTVMSLRNEVDPLFSEIRDVHVGQVGGMLSKKANFIAASYKEKDSLKSISEIKEFMDKFKLVQAEHASLGNHVALATQVTAVTRDPLYAWTLKVEDQIMSMSKPVGKILTKIDSMIRRAKFVPLFTLNRIIRLLSLTSLVYGPKALTNAGVDKILKSLVHCFGLPALRLIPFLEQAGLLTFHNPAETAGVMAELMSSGTKWPKIREEFKLILDANSLDPEGVLADAHSGYVPLSVRLVQLLNNSWKNCAASLNLLRGPALEIAQECPVAIGGPSTGSTSYVAVVFLGGVTRGEIAALRRLSQLEGGRRKFLIITTEVTNYAKLFDSI